MEHMDPEKFKGRMHSLAYGNAMLAAAEDYKKEVLDAQASQPSGQHREVGIDDLLEDPELEHLHAERLSALRRDIEKRAALKRKGHGELQLVEESEFLQVATEEERCVCHFFHRDFERCRILDRHLEVLARKHFGTRFVKVLATDAPFLTVKLQVKVLPCLLMLVGGVATDRLVGFDDLGAKDDFPTAKLEARLLKSGAVEPAAAHSASDDEDHHGTIIRSSEIADEDSDFD